MKINKNGGTRGALELGHQPRVRPRIERQRAQQRAQREGGVRLSGRLRNIFSSKHNRTKCEEQPQNRGARTRPSELPSHWSSAATATTRHSAAAVPDAQKLMTNTSFHSRPFASGTVSTSALRSRSSGALAYSASRAASSRTSTTWRGGGGCQYNTYRTQCSTVCLISQYSCEGAPAPPQTRRRPAARRPAPPPPPCRLQKRCRECPPIGRLKCGGSKQSGVSQ